MRRGAARNPFSAHNLGPHGAHYEFPAGQSIDALRARLDEANWRAELVGPHGAGKSTLLSTLQDDLEGHGRRTVRFFCNDRRPRLPALWWARLLRADVCLMDGGEVISSLQLRLLWAASHLLKKGLVLTTHQPMGFGVPIDVAPDSDAFTRFVHRVAGEEHAGGAAAVLSACGGNGREALVELYDSVERAAGAAPAP